MSRRSPPGPPILTSAAADIVALIDDLSEVELLGDPTIVKDTLTVELRIDTSPFCRGPGGLVVQPFEIVRLTADSTYPSTPPVATVDHVRWLGFPHVLMGSLLCLFLDPGREWDPMSGMAGVLHRLWGWLEDAIAGRFDPRTSLFHALGGIPFEQGSTEVLTITSGGSQFRPGIHRAALRQRTPRRWDLVALGRPAGEGETEGLAIISANPLLLGLGKTLGELITRIDRPIGIGDDRLLPRYGFPTAESVTARAQRAALRLKPGEPLRIIVGARNPALDGPGAYDLAVAVLDPSSLAAAGFVPDADNPGDLGAAALGSMRVDDNRPEIVLRRDHDRPVRWFEGKWIHLFGCGALGSWVGEQLVRAGCRRVTVTDPGQVRRGILVRQNYTEADVGEGKAGALAARLQAISDLAVVEVLNSTSDLVGQPGARCDLIIDASVSHSASALLDCLSTTRDECPPLAQLATDSASATLGILTVTPAGGTVTLSDLQKSTADHVAVRADLEDFGRLWDPDDDGLFAPARGCSVPTFRGSSADAMGISGAAVSLLGPAAQAGITGAFLFALPYTSASVPARTWVPYRPPSESMPAA